jgi:hypothetical protein
MILLCSKYYLSGVERIVHAITGLYMVFYGGSKMEWPGKNLERPAGIPLQDTSHQVFS